MISKTEKIPDKHLVTVKKMQLVILGIIIVTMITVWSNVIHAVMFHNFNFNKDHPTTNLVVAGVVTLAVILILRRCDWYDLAKRVRIIDTCDI